MQIDDLPPVVISILAEQQHVGNPPMDTQYEEVEKEISNTTYSSLPTLQILPTLTIIDNIPWGVGEEEKAKEKA